MNYECRTESNGSLVEACASNPIPNPIQENRSRRITIQELNRGYVVEVGCHSFAISEKAELTAKLVEYINNPSATEQKWFEGNLF